MMKAINAHVISIRNDQDKVRLSFRLRRMIREAINIALAYEDYGRRAEVSVTVTDNEGIRELNRKYRNTDRPTDVLSFPMDDNDGLLGDIVISLERAAAQAAEYGHTLERETVFLCVHSILHLLGYDHETGKQDEEHMFARQDQIMTVIGLTGGLRVRRLLKRRDR